VTTKKHVEQLQLKTKEEKLKKLLRQIDL